MKPDRVSLEFLENVLKRRIKALYQEQLKQEPRNIEVHYSEQSIVVIIDGIVTKTEKFLNNHSEELLSQQVRSTIDHVIQSQLQSLIEEVMKVRVVDLLYNTKVETDRMGVIVIFEVHSNFFL